MTDQQILTIAIAVIFPCVALLYSGIASKDRIGDVNKRIDDRFGEVSKRIDDTNKRFDDMEKRLIDHIDNAFTHMELLLKLHEAEHHKK